MAPASSATVTRGRPGSSAARNARNSRAIAGAHSAPAPAPARRRTAPATRPAPPRRKSGPATQPAAAAIGRVAQQRGAVLLDRLLRGRAWVVLVGALLAGIVFLNVSVLELNRGIATTDTQASSLERANSGLRARVARLDSAERIQRLAAARGFVLPQPGDVTYLRPAAAATSRLAAQRIAPPATLAQQAAAPAAATTTATTTAAPPQLQQSTPVAAAPATSVPAQPAPATQSAPAASSQPATATAGP
jgi:hypothetical protein